MRRALGLCVLLIASPVSADAVHRPAPAENCPAGSRSWTPGMGMFHGSFSYCGPHVCLVDAACSGGLVCREVALSIDHRFYSRGGGHGAPPGPRLHVSRVTGMCDEPEPGIYRPPEMLGAAGDVPDIEPGCRRVPVCVRASVGEPLGTTPWDATDPAAEPDPAPDPEPDPVPDPDPDPEPDPEPAPEPEPEPASTCACSAPTPRAVPSPWLLLGLVVALRRRRSRA